MDNGTQMDIVFIYHMQQILTMYVEEWALSTDISHTGSVVI